MFREEFVDLGDCSEFRQTLAARPPRIVHGTTLLLMGLLVAAVTWSALVEADLVVRGVGRVRPSEIPTRVFTSAGADLEGRVVEASFDEGDTVHKGDVLVRFDTAQLDNRIARLERTIAASEEELTKLTGLEELLQLQLDAAREKAQAELTQAEATRDRAAVQRASEIRRVQSDLSTAEDRRQRDSRLASSGAVSEQELVKTEMDVRQARERLVQAELPVDEAPVAIARRALGLVDTDFAVRRGEVETRRVVKQGEAEAARKELANLLLQRAEAELRSPLDGVVVAGRLRPGDVLPHGKAVLEIAPQHGYRFEAVIPAKDVGNLRVGMPVHIKFDAYDYQTYGVLEGTIVYLSPDSKVATAAADAPEPQIGDVAGGSPAAYIVRIEMSGDEVGRGNLHGRVKLGLGGTAEIVTGRESLLTILVKRIRQTISLG